MSGESRAMITGVTGFVGKGLAARFAELGWKVTGVSRSARAEVPGVDRWQKPDVPDLSGHRAVVHLAGEPVSRRWPDEVKRKIRDSRVDSTRKVVAAIRKLPDGERPSVLVCGSAVGYYGDRGEEILAEGMPPGDGFLADVCREWEAAAREAEDEGVRVVSVRTGLVLGKEGGALKPLKHVFRWGAGGRISNGRQWMPWVHVDDLREAIVHAVNSPALRGPVNGTAPEPERNVDFTRKLAKSLHRPAIFPVPAPLLKGVLGGFAVELLASRRAVPSALVGDGFIFRFEKLEDALGDILEN